MRVIKTRRTERGAARQTSVQQPVKRVSSPWGEQDKWSGPLGHRVHLYALKWFVAARGKKNLKNKGRVFTGLAGTSQRCGEGEQGWDEGGASAGTDTSSLSRRSQAECSTSQDQKKKSIKEGRRRDFIVRHHLPPKRTKESKVKTWKISVGLVEAASGRQKQHFLISPVRVKKTNQTRGACEADPAFALHCLCFQSDCYNLD